MTTELMAVKPYSLFFQALSNPVRIQIVDLLRKRGTLRVSEICNKLDLEQTHVSHALRCLTFCGLVESVREGKSKLYTMNKTTVVPLLRIVDDHLEKFGSNLYSCDVLER
jgi:DNA-binding transcriptional ArsR family regulator